MRLNLSSQIVLNKVPLAYYKPKTTVEYSEISRMEKIHTDIFASSVEGAVYVADQIEKEIKAAQHEGKYYVMALGTGLSLTPIYNELQKRCEAKQLSFRNVVAFNAYEYYPIAKESSLKSINQLKGRFLDHIDIAPHRISSRSTAAWLKTLCRIHAASTSSASRLSAVSTWLCWASEEWVTSLPTNLVPASSR